MLNVDKTYAPMVGYSKCAVRHVCDPFLLVYADGGTVPLSLLKISFQVYTEAFFFAALVQDGCKKE